MSQYSELQVALINARDGYEKRRANFTDPKDKRTHKRQCDLISAHIMDLPELTAARDEAEKLRGRVAQLESAVPWTIYGDNLTATVLRKQAEAVESAMNNEMAVFRLHNGTKRSGCFAQDLNAYAQRLRTQADDAEGEKHCTYPNCRCPFDRGTEFFCLRGLPEKPAPTKS